MIYKMRHDVVWQRAVPCLRASLCVHCILCRRQLVQQVEGLNANNELALEEGLADGGIQHEVVGVQLAAAIATAGVHCSVYRERGVYAWNGIAGGQAIVEIKGI